MRRWREGPCSTRPGVPTCSLPCSVRAIVLPPFPPRLPPCRTTTGYVSEGARCLRTTHCRATRAACRPRASSGRRSTTSCCWWATARRGSTTPPSSAQPRPASSPRLPHSCSRLLPARAAPDRLRGPRHADPALPPPISPDTGLWPTPRGAARGAKTGSQGSFVGVASSLPQRSRWRPTRWSDHARAEIRAESSRASLRGFARRSVEAGVRKPVREGSQPGAWEAPHARVLSLRTSRFVCAWDGGRVLCLRVERVLQGRISIACISSRFCSSREK